MPRLTEARYEDGLGELYTQTDPMEVAQHIFDQAGDIPNSAGLSTLFTTWGQFLDHDLSLTPENEHGETMELGDRDITRSEALDGTGEDGPREFGNAITWQIDGSQIYGSNDIREADVRSFEGGQLRMIDDPTSTHGLLPLATDETVMAGDTSGDDAVFLAGDIRASENPNLLSMHTLFAREHNYWAERLAEANPDWSDQDLFEVARSIVEYELQAITYNEWLPHLIGGALPDDIDYDPNVDGQVSLEFSTAAFRFGHTMVSGHMPRLNEDGSIFGDGHLELLDHFFNPSSVREGGIDALIRGQAAEHAQEVDTQVIDDLNFFLATPDGVSGFSLPALNLIRGADHGMGSYLDVRAQLLGDVNLSTLDPTDFSVITDDSELQEQMAGVYDTVFDVDLWVGGLAETAIAGTQMGPLFTFILSDQFYRTSAADETFGELDPRINAEMLAEIQASGLSDVIIRNTDIDTLQDDPFLTAPRELTFEALVTGSLQDDTLDLAAVETPKSIFAEDGDDVVTITGGTTIGGKLSLGDGADSVMMSSGATRFDIDMGRGDADESVDLSGTARVGDDVCTDAGDDLIRMDDVATIADDLMTRGGDDRIEL
ncbi:MAG: peroxidase family protein, partial [Pseudomonadota bacterium]